MKHFCNIKRLYIIERVKMNSKGYYSSNFSFQQNPFQKKKTEE